MKFRIDTEPHGAFFRGDGRIVDEYAVAIQEARLRWFNLTEHDRAHMDVTVSRLDTDGTETTVWRNGGRL